MMTKFYLLRHGENEWNADLDRYSGESDIPLSALGKKQAEKAAAALSKVKIDVIYASPLSRAVETARPIAERHSLEIHTDQRIKEINFGKWEGKTKEEAKKQFPENWRQWNADPTHTRAGETGETAYEVFRRADEFFREKMEQHVDRNVLVVAHNTLNRLYMIGTLSAPFQKYRTLVQNNTGISILELTPGQAQWLQINSISHLEQPE